MTTKRPLFPSRILFALTAAATAAMLASCATRAHDASPSPPPGNQFAAAPLEMTSQGRSLFLKNCAHCHGDDALGDEGPNLHGLKKSDEWTARRIRNGVKGEMTAFGEKFKDADVNALIAYLRTLR